LNRDGHGHILVLVDFDSVWNLNGDLDSDRNINLNFNGVRDANLNFNGVRDGNRLSNRDGNRLINDDSDFLNLFNVVRNANVFYNLNVFVFDPWHIYQDFFPGDIDIVKLLNSLDTGNLDDLLKRNGNGNSDIIRLRHSNIVRDIDGNLNIIEDVVVLVDGPRVITNKSSVETTNKSSVETTNKSSVVTTNKAVVNTTNKAVVDTTNKAVVDTVDRDTSSKATRLGQKLSTHSKD